MATLGWWAPTMSWSHAHSGKSREVLEILAMSRHLGVEKIIGVTSHVDSDLRQHSDFILDMGTITEPCPLGLTPSASMAVMLAISDALALALLEQKGVTREDYGLRHHGYLGRAARADNSRCEPVGKGVNDFIRL